MRGQPFQDIFEHFIRESRSGMPDVAQLASVIDKIFSRPRGFGNASDHSLLLYARLDLEPGFGAFVPSGRYPVEIYEPDLVSMFCEFPTAARISRRSMLEHLADSEAIYFSSHFPFTSIGQVTQHEGAYEWKFL